MKEGGIIASEHCRHPLGPLPGPTRAGLIELARRLDVMALRWGR
jgi:4-hydroxy-tetrahydrodipicolinate synthase